MKKARHTNEEIAKALSQARAGTPVAEIIGNLRISKRTFDRWKIKYHSSGQHYQPVSGGSEHLKSDLNFQRDQSRNWNYHIVQSVIRMIFDSSISIDTLEKSGFLHRNFKDYDVSPYPACGAGSLIESSRSFNENFICNVQSIFTTFDPDLIISELAFFKKNFGQKRLNSNQSPSVRAYGIELSASPESTSKTSPDVVIVCSWQIESGVIVGRHIHRRSEKEAKFLNSFRQTLFALRGSIMIVMLFLLGIFSSAGAQVMELIVGTAGNETAYSLSFDMIMWPMVLGLAIVANSWIVIFLTAQHPIVPKRNQAGVRLWYPPVRAWQLGIGTFLAAIVHAGLALAMYRAAVSLELTDLIYKIGFALGLQCVLAIMWSILTFVSFVDSARVPLEPWLQANARIVVALAVFIGLLIVFLPNDGLRVAPATLAAWAMLTLCGLSFLIVMGDRFRLPLLSAVTLLFLVNSCAGWDDHHAVATLSDERQGDNRQPVDHPLIFNDFDAWLAGSAKTISAGSSEKPYPVFIVTSEGGGTRAAAMTAMILDELRGRYDRFPDHLYAIVGVSGGSVGAAAFATALHEDKLPVRLSSMTSAASTATGWQNSLHADLLSPTLRGLFFGDFVSKFVPNWLIDLNTWSRARALETAWTDAWNRATEEDIAHLDFNDLRPPGKRAPALVLLTTAAADGERMAVSHVRFIPNSADPLEDREAQCPYRSAVRTLQEITPSRVSVATAAFMSARFPIVSPAARVDGPDGPEYFVDGGYYENSGASTVRDIIKSISCRAKNARIIVIRIENSEVDAVPPVHKWWLPDIRFDELSKPIGALYNTRQAHGKAAVALLEAELGSLPAPRAKSIVFKLRPVPEEQQSEKLTARKIVLSWFITAEARAAIASQLTTGCNAKAFDEVGRQLGEVDTQSSHYELSGCDWK